MRFHFITLLPSVSKLRWSMLLYAVFFVVLNVVHFQKGIAAEAPQTILDKFKRAENVDVIIEYDDNAIEQTATTMRKKGVLEERELRLFRRNEYITLKDKVDKKHSNNDIVDVKNYSDLPIKYKRFKSEAAFKKFIATPGIKAVYENVLLQRVLVDSLPLINQPSVALGNAKGGGVTVAVLDDGIDYTNSAFGPCTAPNTPAATCKVVVSQDFADVPNTAKSHGTNVSAIVLGVAPATKIAMLNVFSSSGALASDIIDAINWSIANKSAYNIQAMNLSLGGTTKFTSPCTNDWSTTPIQNARNAGISVVIASGNSGFTDGIASPACAPAAISVGAVYDKNIGGINFGSCQDTSTNTDKVTCFSNSASFLTMLAPGAAITAAGITQYGTSQAAPHVTGAVAVLRALYPSETLTQTKNRLVNAGTPVVDSRNSISKPRLNLLEAMRPNNDTFANRQVISGASGSTSGISTFASKEANEPNHAGNTGGASVWWKWVATANGQLSITTSDSTFDTLLGIYQGNSIGTLTSVAANDNEQANSTTSKVLLQAVVGREYQIAVDGSNGSKGSINLSWALNSNAVADLGLTLTGTSSVQLGQTYSYTITINNAGPQAATNANMVFNIPTGASLVNLPNGCSLNANILTCLVSLIPNAGSQSVAVELVWNDLTQTVSLIAAVSGEVPDTNSVNNSGALQVSLATNTGGGSDPNGSNPNGGNTNTESSDNTDAPTLPEWAAIALMFILLGQNAYIKINQR